MPMSEASRNINNNNDSSNSNNSNSHDSRNTYYRGLGQEACQAFMAFMAFMALTKGEALKPIVPMHWFASEAYRSIIISNSSNNIMLVMIVEVLLYIGGPSGDLG